MSRNTVTVLIYHCYKLLNSHTYQKQLYSFSRYYHRQSCARRERARPTDCVQSVTCKEILTVRGNTWALKNGLVVNSHLSTTMVAVAAAGITLPVG
jgi:hypothetical protein